MDALARPSPRYKPHGERTEDADSIPLMECDRSLLSTEAAPLPAADGPRGASSACPGAPMRSSLFAYGFRANSCSPAVRRCCWCQSGRRTLRSGTPLGTAWPPTLWHAHEMLFGFVGGAIAGFLLTAVPSWTGERGFAGRPLIWWPACGSAARLLIASLRCGRRRRTRVDLASCAPRSTGGAAAGARAQSQPLRCCWCCLLLAP